MPSTITSAPMPSSAPRRVRVATPSTETSPWIIVNQSATVVARPGVSMQVQATCSFLDVVLADNRDGSSLAVAFGWSAGTVTVVTAEMVSNVTAVRFIAVSGAAVGEVAT